MDLKRGCSGYNSSDLDYKYDKRDLKNDKIFSAVIEKSRSLAEVLKAFSFSDRSGSTYQRINTRIRELKLDTSHFVGQAFLKGRSHNWNNKISLTEILKKGTKYQSNKLRKRLIKEQILREECAICELGPTWNNKPITLRLDHIDGDHLNNELANLRLVCPNCDSQLPTFCGRNRKKDLHSQQQAVTMG